MGDPRILCSLMSFLSPVLHLCIHWSVGSYFSSPLFGSWKGKKKKKDNTQKVLLFNVTSILLSFSPCSTFYTSSGKIGQRIFNKKIEWNRKPLMRYRKIHCPLICTTNECGCMMGCVMESSTAWRCSRFLISPGGLWWCGIPSKHTQLSSSS